MNQSNFSSHEPNSNENQCFFTKLLHECSNEQPDQQQTMKPEPIIFHSSSMQTNPQQTQQLQNWAWHDQEVIFEDLFEGDNEHFERAKSLRVEQQRKIDNFIQVFGKPKKGEPFGQIRTFSPQKKKKINKYYKQSK